MKKNILLVDDDVITNVVHQMILEQNGDTGYIENVRSGRDALAFLKKSIADNRPLPDVILLDVNMPDMNGFEFLQAIRQEPSIDRSRFKIIVLSSSIDKRDIDLSLDLGADEFLSKPLEYAYLPNIFRA